MNDECLLFATNLWAKTILFVSQFIYYYRYFNMLTNFSINRILQESDCSSSGNLYSCSSSDSNSSSMESDQAGIQTSLVKIAQRMGFFTRRYSTFNPQLQNSRCYLCPSAKKLRNSCCLCNQYACNEHWQPQRIICFDCGK